MNKVGAGGEESNLTPMGLYIYLR